MKILQRKISTKEYLRFRGTTNWKKLDSKMVTEGLKNDIVSFCAVEDSKVVGICRLIGDGSIYFYIQDLIVLPEYRNKGVGRKLMLEIGRYLELNHKGAFVGLMAAQGMAKFYESLNFIQRMNDSPGMYKYV